MKFNRDWTEDFSHENGNYQCVCGKCGNTFMGHKRRVRCKVCDNSAQATEKDGKHHKCRGVVEHTMDGTEYSCEYNTTIDCSECKYNVVAGIKDPEAKCNQLI